MSVAGFAPPASETLLAVEGLAKQLLVILEQDPAQVRRDWWLFLQHAAESGVTDILMELGRSPGYVCLSQRHALDGPPKRFPLPFPTSHAPYQRWARYWEARADGSRQTYLEAELGLPSAWVCRRGPRSGFGPLKMPLPITLRLFEDPEKRAAMNRRNGLEASLLGATTNATQASRL